MRLLAALLLALLLAGGARAQTTAQVVVGCGTPNSTLTVGSQLSITMDTTGKLCDATTATASFTTPTGSYTDRSSSIAVGGTSQQIAAANGARLRLQIQNPCFAAGQGIGSAESIFVNFGAAASSAGGSVELAPCGTYDTGAGPVTTQAVNVVAATNGHLYTAKEM